MASVTPQPGNRLRDDALRIWRAGLEAVRSDRLVREHVRLDGNTLVIESDSTRAGDEAIRVDLTAVRRLAVVGAGKAGAGMAKGIEEVLGARTMEEKSLVGWVNVPADCVRKLGRIHLHAARPAGVNEPTEEGVAGADEILRIVSSQGPDDVCIALVSGGGSALLPAPIEGISLEEKIVLTRFLSAAGANISELNTVRRQLSRIKGGGLARACRAGRLIAFVISDIAGDPLDLISSGPTVLAESRPAEALAVLDKYSAREHGIPTSIFDALERQRAAGLKSSQLACEIQNLLIGNSATAVDAAGIEADRLGYDAAMTCAAKPEGPVEPIGRHLADMAIHMLKNPGPNCLISGGEGTVRLVDESVRGLGGRNQQTVLAALMRLNETGAVPLGRGVVILSGGTDGEDGPTDAAGAIVDAQVIAEAANRGLDAYGFLSRNDAYHFFEPLGALIKTGPTHTNVGDLRVVLVDRPKRP